eukprot:g2988.t1
MGNEFSIVDDTRKEQTLELSETREPLTETNNRKALVVRHPTQSKSRKTSLGHTRKRSRSYFTHGQPAGSNINIGSFGTRWPIDGVSSDCLKSQGELEFLWQLNENDGNTVYWRLDLKQYNQGPCGRTKEGCLPRFVCSSVFQVRPIGTRLRWKLIIAPKDIENDSFSIYLQNENSRNGEVFEIDTQYSLFVASRETSSENTYFIRHCFSSNQPTWGIQNMISLKEATNFWQQGEISIGLNLKWVRDSKLFPPQYITLNGSEPELYQISESPKILMIENFLSMAECEALIEKAEPHLYRSRVASGTETPSRTSSSMFFTGTLKKIAIVKSTSQKIANLIERSDINEGRNIKPTESLQVVKYRLGEFYSEHYDNRSGYPELRAATIIVYLRDTEAGGATYFPKASKTLPNADVLPQSMIGKQELMKNGLRVYPRQGRAIFFWSRLANGDDDKHSLHAAEPVIEGEKWIATRWFREFDHSP